MSNYTANLLSFQTHGLDSLNSILSCPTLKQVLFPATLPISPGGSIYLTSPEELDVSMIPKEFFEESLVHIPLTSEHGIEFFMTICFGEVVVPNVFGLTFTSEHLQAGMLNLELLKALFSETIPVFKGDYGAVYDKQFARRLHQTRSRKFFKDERNRSYPLQIQWMSYFGEEMLFFLRSERFSRLQTYSEKYELNNGMMVILQEEPFDDNNPEHRRKQAQAQAEMQFDTLLSQQSKLS